VDRKLVKQTVMTSVYGVTHIGARQQIENRLRERGAFGGDRDQQWAVGGGAAGGCRVRVSCSRGRCHDRLV
jgi:hypothetical protein